MSPRLLSLKLVGDRLDLESRLVADLKRLPNSSFEAFTDDWRNVPTAESLLRRAVETLLDVARHLLSSGFGLGSLEYRQVARYSAEHGLVRDPELGRVFEEMAGFRNRLTHHYEDVTPQELFGVVKNHLPDLEAISNELRSAATRMTNDK